MFPDGKQRHPDQGDYEQRRRQVEWPATPAARRHSRVILGHALDSIIPWHAAIRNQSRLISARQGLQSATIRVGHGVGVRVVLVVAGHGLSQEYRYRMAFAIIATASPVPPPPTVHLAEHSGPQAGANIAPRIAPIAVNANRFQSRVLPMRPSYRAGCADPEYLGFEGNHYPTAVVFDS